MIGIIPTLVFGFFLGVKHAFDSDHIIAVSTMVTEHKNPFAAAGIGTFWGMGHTTTLFIFGLLVLIFKISISARVGEIFELLVGVMLFILGVSAIMRSLRNKHNHLHNHGNIKHKHMHIYKENQTNHHHKSFFIGTVHGLAGSGALMILVLSTIKSTIEGIYYILIFGIGSIIGMTLISLILGLPFIYTSERLPYLGKYLNLTAGIAGIIWGTLSLSFSFRSIF